MFSDWNTSWATTMTRALQSLISSTSAVISAAIVSNLKENGSVTICMVRHGKKAPKGWMASRGLSSIPKPSYESSSTDMCCCITSYNEELEPWVSDILIYATNITFWDALGATQNKTF